MSEIITDTEDQIFTITLNRPEKRNALNDALINELKAALQTANKDESLRVILIKAAGKDFCSGADLSALQKISESDVLENMDDADNLRELFSIIRKVKIPVVAAVHGRALAGGCGLATACDLVLATETARFGYPEVKIGFVPAMVMAITRRNVSEKRAFDLLVGGRAIPATEAERIGLINRVFADDAFDAETDAALRDLAERSPSAVQLSKRLLYNSDGMSFESAVRAGADVNVVARATDDMKAGVARFLDRAAR